MMTVTNNLLKLTTININDVQLTCADKHESHQWRDIIQWQLNN